MTQPTNYNDPFFDDVHSCQTIFTVIMNALAYPGKIGQLPPGQLKNISGDYATALQPLITLLDLETSHYIFSSDSYVQKEVSTFLEATTHSTSSVLETADFILCLEKTARSIYHRLHKGTLANPNRGATLIYHVDGIHDQKETTEGAHFTLEGPGIPTIISLSVSGLNPEEPIMWQLSRTDYPLGIDVLLVSTTGKIVGIPRSTTIIQPGVN